MQDPNIWLAVIIAVLVIIGQPGSIYEESAAAAFVPVLGASTTAF